MAEIPDDLFVRVALRNSIITEEQLAVARRGAEESGKPLIEVLIVQEALTKKKADAVISAIEQKIAQKKSDTPAHPVPPVTGASAPAAEPKSGAQRKAGVEHEYENNESELKRLIRHIVTSPLHQRILEHVVKGNISVLEPGSLAKRTGAAKSDVIRVLKRWQRFRVATSLGGGTYNFSPGDKDAKLIKLFMRCWGWPALHGKLLAYVLEQGKK